MGAYDGTYITVASVRRTVGIDTSDISDADVGSTITEVEAQVPRYFNTVFTPTEVIQISDGDGTNRLLIDHNPLLAVRELRIDDTEYDPDTLEVYKDARYIFLGQTSTTPVFANKRNSVAVKYVYGTLEHSKTIKTVTDAASVAGSSIVLSVTSGSSFTVGNWIEILGMDGNREAAEITGAGASSITVDKLLLAHESGSNVFELVTSPNFTKLMNIIAGIAMGVRVIGESSTDITGYELGELRVQKGEPYTQWREQINQLIAERNDMMKRISIRPRVQ